MVERGFQMFVLLDMLPETLTNLNYWVPPTLGKKAESISVSDCQ